VFPGNVFLPPKAGVLGCRKGERRDATGDVAVDRATFIGVDDAESAALTAERFFCAL
jgi:nitrate reductase cytochrome c-type subunit